MSVNDNLVNMEYEAQVMVSASEYNQIKADNLKISQICRVIRNENAYFDTPNLDITNHHMVLRVRKINDDKKELTLKIQRTDVCIEINHNLTPEQEKELYETGRISNQPIRGMLMDSAISLRNIKYITSLKTERMEIQYNNYLLVLDKNYYRDIIDYNIEVESTSEFEAKRILKEILDSFGIEYRTNYINKAKRAISNN